MSIQKTEKATVKAAYARPKLTEYGSVRNLTGGSAGTKNGDGGVMTMQ